MADFALASNHHHNQSKKEHLIAPEFSPCIKNKLKGETECIGYHGIGERLSNLREFPVC